MRFGAHVPTRGRLARAVEYAEAIGADAFQIFISNPRAWAPPAVSVEAAREFVRRRHDAGIGEVFVHSTYLVNVASPDADFRQRSVELAAAELRAAAAIEADGLVVHAGAGGPGERAHAVRRAADAIRTVAEATDGPRVLLELTAGATGAVAATVSQAVELLDAVDHPRVGLCLDTCHLFAAGYPLDRPDRARTPLEELRALGREEALGLVHANDSRDPRGSRRDRHDHPGQGRIGPDGFRAVLADPSVRRCAVLVETRGREPEHRRDVAALRDLAAV
jgi:deoxyribonuclease-4